MYTDLMARSRTLNAARLTVLVITVAGSSGIRAASIELEGSAGVGYSDNITRVESNKQSATIGSLGLRFDITEDSRRLNADLSGDLAWLAYSGDTYSSEVAGNAAGRARVGLVDERLSWTVEDSFGQTRRDMFSAPTPGNRENVNYFATGPDLRLPIGSVMSMRLEGRYTRVDYEDSPADTQRYGGTFALERELSSTALFSLNASHQRVEPRGGSMMPDYDRSSAFLRYAARGARSDFSFDAGADRVKGEGLDTTGALLRLEVSRQIGVYSRISARLGNEITDSGAVFGQQIGTLAPVGTEGDALVQEALPYTNRYFEFGWSATGRITNLGLWATWADEDYEQGSVFDRQRYSIDLSGSRAVGPRTTIAAGARYHRYDFDSPIATDNDEIAYRLALTWSVNPRLGLELSGERSEYSSDAGGGVGDETRFWLRLKYGKRFRESAPP
jgi:hypothetical protein